VAQCAHPECGRRRPAAGWRKSGYALDDIWYCSALCVHRAAAGRLQQDEAEADAATPASQPKLGSLLVHQRAISEDLLERALDSQSRSGQPLGSELRRLGVKSLAVLRALAAQQGVSYLTSCDVARVAAGPGGLNPDAVRALRVVPFDADPERAELKVACTAPVPRRSLAALHRLTGWKAQAYLVSEDTWQTLATAYGESRTTEDPVFAECDAENAAARVARLAESERSVKLLSARCDPFTWIRVQGTAGVEDLFVPRDRDKEAACRPALTSH
jgi:hypothetical protein